MAMYGEMPGLVSQDDMNVQYGAPLGAGWQNGGFGGGGGGGTVGAGGIVWQNNSSGAPALGPWGFGTQPAALPGGAMGGPAVAWPMAGQTAQIYPAQLPGGWPMQQPGQAQWTVGDPATAAWNTGAATPFNQNVAFAGATPYGNPGGMNLPGGAGGPWDTPEAAQMRAMAASAPSYPMQLNAAAAQSQAYANAVAVAQAQQQQQQQQGGMLPSFGGPEAQGWNEFGGQASYDPFQTNAATVGGVQYGTPYTASTAALADQWPSLLQGGPSAGNWTAIAGDRPSHWRRDYTGSRGVFGRLRRSNSMNEDLGRQPRAILHDMIRHSALPGGSAPFTYDLRLNPNTIRFRNLSGPVTPNELSRFVCEPPLPFMRFMHDRLPWYIDVFSQSNPAGVTLLDLFTAVFTCMNTQIGREEYDANELDNRARSKIADAYQRRLTDLSALSSQSGTVVGDVGIAAVAARGVLRVDFLRRECILEGFSRGRNGMWELKTRATEEY